MNQHTYCYKIGDFYIELELPLYLTEEERFSPFNGNGFPKTRVSFVQADSLPQIAGIDLVRESDAVYSEYFADGAYIRTFHGVGTKEAYALLREKECFRWECLYLKEAEYHFQSMRSCFAHIAFERILIEQKEMILHAALIRVGKDGILFTGPSGIGKSTQADLWRQNEGAEILNGDRTILRRAEEGWYGYGSPYAGSSGVYRNERALIRGIAVLGQGRGNAGKRLSVAEAFKCLYAGMTLNQWNPSFMETAAELLHRMSMEIPVYRLSCTPDVRAVVCLKELLKNETEEVVNCRENL